MSSWQKMHINQYLILLFVGLLYRGILWPCKTFHGWNAKPPLSNLLSKSPIPSLPWLRKKEKEREDTTCRSVATNKCKHFLDSNRTSPQWWVSKPTVHAVTSQWSAFLSLKVNGNKCQVCEPTESLVTPLRKGWWCKYGETKRASDQQAQAWSNHPHRHYSSMLLT